jgi:hypothetical protein
MGDFWDVVLYSLVDTALVSEEITVQHPRRQPSSYYRRENLKSHQFSSCLTSYESCYASQTYESYVK